MRIVNIEYSVSFQWNNLELKVKHHTCYILFCERISKKGILTRNRGYHLVDLWEGEHNNKH